MCCSSRPTTAWCSSTPDTARTTATTTPAIGPTRHLFKPVFDHDETALRQVERLGFTRDDVRHIVVTHFDMDHIGGISDFPDAQIHATAAEVQGAVQTRRSERRSASAPAQWAHGPKLVEHDPDGEKWRGFAAAKELDEIAPGIVLVSLPGHTRGHACIAVDAGHRWVLHCGDAFYHPGTLDGHSKVPAPIKVIEPLLAFDRKKVRGQPCSPHRAVPAAGARPVDGVRPRRDTCSNTRRRRRSHARRRHHQAR